MEINLPILADQLSSIYESGLGSTKVTQIFAGLSLEEALVFSLFFLPFFLLAWLAVFKLFDIQGGAKKISVLILVVAYIFSISFLKIKGEQKMKAEKLKNDVTYYMMHNFIRQVPTESLCKALKIESYELVEMKKIDTENSYIIIDQKIILKEPKIIKLMKAREDLLKDFVQEIVEKQDSLDVTEIAKTTDFGNVSTEVIENIFSKTEGEIKLIKDKNNKLVLTNQHEPPSGG